MIDLRDFWTPENIRDSRLVLDYLDHVYDLMYGKTEAETDNWGAANA